MDDTTPIEDQSNEAEVVDFGSMTVDELRAEYARLSEAIDVLKEQPRTIELAEQINGLRVQRNEVASTANALRAAEAEVEDVPLEDPVAEADGGDADPEADADGDANDTADTADGDTATDTAEAADGDAAEVETVDATNETPAEPDVTSDPAETPPVATEVTSTATPAATHEAGETATPEDVTTTDNTVIAQEETTVSDTTPTPDNTPSDDVIAEAEAIVESAASGGELVDAVTAGVRPPAAPSVPERPRVGYLAGGGQNEFAQGSPIDFSQLGQAMDSVRDRKAPHGETISGIVASIPGFEQTPDLPVPVLSTRMSPVETTALIAETVEAHRRKRQGEQLDAVTAAICEPLDIIREIPECGVTVTPFADLFPQRPVGRLGFQYFPGMSLADTNDGINVWTEGDQEAVDEGNPATWKPTVLIQCSDAVPVKAEELVASAQVDDSTELSQPEKVQEFMHKMAVQRARRREQYLLGKFDATASPYDADYSGALGAFAALIRAINELMPRLVYGERLDEGDYDVVLEPGHLNKLVNDESARLFGDTVKSRRAEIINRIKEETGAGQVTILRDFKTGGFGALSTPGGASAELPTLFDTNRVRLVPSQAYLYGATGEEATGWQTDAQLTRQNRMQWFSKEWLLLAKHGCHPAAFVDLTACGNGARANGVEPADCTGEAS